MLYIKDGIIRDRSRIVIVKDGYQTINPTDEMVIADGWTQYVPETPSEPVATMDEQLQDLILDQYNERTDVSDEDALKRPLLVYPWSNYINKSLKTGQIVSHNDELWRVRQDISPVLDIYPPDTSTAALYEVIKIEASGTIDDPIEYNINMAIFKDKYYIEDGIKYKALRDSGNPLYAKLSSLVGNYVEIAKEDTGDTGSTTEELGTINNPIEYVAWANGGGDYTPLEVGKYYTQNGIKYKCIMGWDAPTSELKSLVAGGFVSVVE